MQCNAVAVNRENLNDWTPARMLVQQWRTFGGIHSHFLARENGAKNDGDTGSCSASQLQM